MRFARWGEQVVDWHRSIAHLFGQTFVRFLLDEERVFVVILHISEQAFVERTSGSEFLSDPLWRIKPWLLFLNLTAFPPLLRPSGRISACFMVGNPAGRQRPLVASILVRLPSAWSSRYS